MKKQIIPLLVIMGIMLYYGCKKTPEIPGDLNNKIEFGSSSIDTVSYFFAEISTKITKTGGNEILDYGHCWNTKKQPTVENNKTSFGKLDSPTTCKSKLPDLNDNAIYYIRPYISYKNGIVYGEETSIKTLKTGKPIVKTNYITNIKIHSASCSCTNDDGGYTIIARGVCWNKTGNPTLENRIGYTNEGNGTGNFKSQITGLNDNTTYYVTAYAKNEKGTAYGEIKTLTTLKLNLAVVITATVDNITLHTATCGGNVINNGNGTITARGVCWNTTGIPTLENSIGHTTDGGGIGSFVNQITGLNDNTTYYVTAYAKNEKGTAYGEVKYFTTQNGFIDARDGNEYVIVNIGNQTWMMENLNYKTSGSWCYDNDSSNCEIYGRLYTWNDAMNACPTGWHLPSDEEWKTLEMYLGMSRSEANQKDWRGIDEGGKLKEIGITLWRSPNTDATNNSGFTALPGSSRSFDGSFKGIGDYGYWWTSTEYSDTFAWGRSLSYNNGQVCRHENYKPNGLSVRCVKD